MSIVRGIIILSFILSPCNANNSAIEYVTSYIDGTHKMLSETIINWSEALDTTVSEWLEDYGRNQTTVDEGNMTSVNERNLTTVDERNMTSVNETNTTIVDEQNMTSVNETNTTSEVTYIASSRTTAVTDVPVQRETTVTDAPMDTSTLDPNASGNTLEEKVHSVDQFFQNAKYLNETENIFIRVRVENYLQSKESNDFDLTARAQMPFSKSRKRFKIFVDNLTLDNGDEILKDTSENDDDAKPDIGIHYFASRHKILSKYSIGLSGIDPFVQARYNMPMNIGEWLIDPVQLFRYSSDDKFEEETNIYFDRKVGEKSLLRIQLHRSTQEEVDGMNYVLSAQYYRSTKKDTGFVFGQTFVGNTEYEYTTEKDTPYPKTKKYSGIHDYITSFTWRANIWRKWFYYEVRPSVSFHKEYDYDPNYRVRVFFDFYFGRFN